MSIFNKTTNCKDCPCLNNDYEEGGTCNLGYECDLEWTKDKDLIYCSRNCGLTDVNHNNGKYIPVYSETTKIRPENWDKN